MAEGSSRTAGLPFRRGQEKPVERRRLQGPRGPRRANLSCGSAGLSALAPSSGAGLARMVRAAAPRRVSGLEGSGRRFTTAACPEGKAGRHGAPLAAMCEGNDDRQPDRSPDQTTAASADAVREIAALTLAYRPLREGHASGFIVWRDGGRGHGRRKVLAGDCPVDDGDVGLIVKW